MYGKLFLCVCIFQLITGILTTPIPDPRKDADIKDLPFSVQLSGKLMGAGIIIGPNVILSSGTAAIAFQRGDIDTVYYGATKLNGDDIQKIGIERALTYPGFSDENFDNIGLIFLNGSLDLSGDKVKSFDLPSPNEPIPELMLLTGYASEKPTVNEIPTTLKYEMVVKSDHKKCEALFKRRTHRSIPKNVTCIQELTAKQNLQFSMGAIGSPLIFGNSVYGIISVLIDGTTTTLPSAFTQVGPYVQWIKENTSL